MLRIVYLVVSALISAGICWLTGAYESLRWVWQLPVGFIVVLLVLLVCYFLLIVVMSKFVDMEKKAEEDNGFFRAVVHGAIELVIPLIGIRVHTQGLEKIPDTERCLVVSNHLFELDPAFLMRYFKRQKLAFIYKREVDHMPLVGPFLHKLLGQPVNRENDREALKTILSCVKILQEDKASIAVFPEGYCSKEHKLHPFRNGVFKIAQKTQVPIVVCTLRNTHLILHNFKRLKPTDIHVHVLGVITPEQMQGRNTVQIGKQVYDMMAEDLGPELVWQEIPETP